MPRLTSLALILSFLSLNCQEVCGQDNYKIELNGKQAYTKGIDLNKQKKIPSKKTNPQKKKNLGDLLIKNAEKYLGVKYQYNGRNTKKNPGLGCLGLVFKTYAQTFNYQWNSFSVFPSEMIKDQRLGTPVEGLEGILREEIDYSKLKKGDILYLLFQDYQPMKDRDKPLVEINGSKYWPWHVVLYAGERRVIHARPGDKVGYDKLKDLGFDALYAQRRTKK